jgi:acetolactate decarboxylase
MPKLEVTLPAALDEALRHEAERTGRSASTIVMEALSRHLDVTVHTLFQVSTSGALVAGVFDGEVSVGSILDHGDFGLGTFADLDGEMVVLDGQVYQVKGDRTVVVAERSARAPFAVVTRFAPTSECMIGPLPDLAALEQLCDEHRTSGNIFYAIRLDGQFDTIRTRAVNPPKPGTRLVDAAKSQSEFSFETIAGTLVGLWSPGFSSAFSVAGYHFHFLSDDKQHGGHLLALSAQSLRLRVEALTEFHLALPESATFLEADLSKNTAEELAYAEQAH